MKKLLIGIGILIVAIIIVVIIKKNSKQDAPENFTIGQAGVTEVSVLLQESFPVQVQVSVSGELSDACTVLGDVIQTKDEKDKSFAITLETKRPLDVECAQMITPYNTVFPLQGVDGLVKGEYTVSVNGVSTSFRFDTDNFISNLDTLK